MSSASSPATPAPAGMNLGLGLDAGGTQTRWAVATLQGRIVAEGAVGPLSALQVATPAGHLLWQQTVTQLQQQVQAAVAAVAAVTAVDAGFSGYGDQAPAIVPLLAQHLQLPAHAVHLSSDAELSYRAAFEPGEGYLVVAGTGSIALHIDAQGQMHRAGGLGGVLDDAGSGYWIAREALRHIWRSEDETPGAWRQSPLAQAVFQHIGGHEWRHTRQFLAVSDRGALGRLAMAVAASAEVDPQAQRILTTAGAELARLANILSRRLGPRPIALAGRVWQLHPRLEASFKAALEHVATVNQSTTPAHYAAARRAALIAGY